MFKEFLYQDKNYVIIRVPNIFLSLYTRLIVMREKQQNPKDKSKGIFFKMLVTCVLEVTKTG